MHTHTNLQVEPATADTPFCPLTAMPDTASGCTTPLHKQVPYLSMDHRQLYMRVYYLYTRCVGLNTAVALWTDAGVGGGET